jgi:hypothetical protein
MEKKSKKNRDGSMTIMNGRPTTVRHQVVGEKTPRVGKIVDPEYLVTLESIALIVCKLVQMGATSDSIKVMNIVVQGIQQIEQLAKKLELLQPKQDRWRTDKEIEARL